jgi:hypothetical protein
LFSDIALYRGLLAQRADRAIVELRRINLLLSSKELFHTVYETPYRSHCALAPRAHAFILRNVATDLGLHQAFDLRCAESRMPFNIARRDNVV